jgi:hypothetical protein
MPNENWRTAAAYDYLADLDMAGVAFEFLRRNPDYQAGCKRIVSQDALSADGEAKSAGLARRWGLAFPADPHVRAGEQIVFWLPDVLASTVILVALNGRWDGPSLAYDPENWPGLIALREAPDGVFIQLSDDGTVHHLWLPLRPNEGESVAAMLPLDDAAPVRIDATAAFWRTLARKRSKQQRSPPLWKARLIPALQALDGRQSGASYRAIATALYGEERIAAEPWKTSSLRDTTIRLVRRGLFLMRGGYRRLLGKSPDD